MFDQKKLVLSLCIAVCAAGFVACGEGGGDSSACKPCQTVTSCGDILSFTCVDVMHDGNKFCVPKDTCTNKTVDSCTLNEKVIAFETDVDCGGFCADMNSGNANVCANDAKCRVDADCKSGNCENGKCKVKQCQSNEECGIGLAKCTDDGVCISCMDGVKNNDESDVDCGGWCGATCENTKKCNAPSDCQTNQCEGGTCKGEIREAQPGDLMINEFLDSAKASKPFMLNGGVTACEFIEIASVATDVVKLDGMTLNLLRTDDGKNNTISIPLKGNLQPKHLLVIHNCEQPLVLPQDASDLSGPKTIFTQKATYDATFVAADGATGAVTQIPSIAKSDAYNRATDYDASTSFDLAKDNLGAIDYATPGYCMNGGTYSTGCIPACSNNQKDIFETDKDCGGPCDNKCKNGATCKVDDDCASKACGDGGVCSVPTCNADEECTGEGAKCDMANHVCMDCGDGIKNNDESDVDCGGSCKIKCANDLHCNSDSDCLTNECGGDGKCTGEVPEKAKLSDLVINEVLVNADTNKKFTNLKGEKQCEFIEIVNISSKTVDLSSITVHAVNMSETSPKETLNQKLEGYYLPSKHALVMHDLKQCPLSLKSWAQDIDMKDRSLTNEKDYHIYLTAGTEQGPTFEVSKELGKKGYSATLSPDLDTTSDIVDHSTVSEYLASPGMCTNGHSFINNCASTCDNDQVDDGEMGVDCGGICSATCANGTTCEKNSDCTSDFCNASKECADSPCNNGLHDDGEMGVDCGGICSATCPNGTTCENAGDCTSGYCNNDNVCATAPCTGDEECGKGGKCNASGICETCGDGEKNGYETGTDCGGYCDNKCAGGEGCEKDDDCLSGVCTEATHTCTVFDCETPGVGDILITEVMGSPKTSEDFSFLTGVKQMEFIEIANTSTRRLDLSKVILKWKKTTGTTATEKTLSACLDVHGAVIISKDAITGLPVGVTNQTILPANTISNGDPYSFWLETKETTPVIIDEVTRAGNTSTGVSQVRNPTLDKTATTLVKSKTATSNAYDNSPGYCTDGTSFESGCTTP